MIPIQIRKILGTRRGVLLVIMLAGLWSAYYLHLTPSGLIPSSGGLKLAGEFFGAAATPAFSYEGEFVPEAALPLWVKTLKAAATTIIFAVAATSLSMTLGLPLGFLASSAWWADECPGGRSWWLRWFRRTLPSLAHGATRTGIGLMRSVHELIWAVLFLAAMGLSPLAAVLAIAIPYTGILAKICSEMIDEAPRDSALALRASGASGIQVFVFGLLPRAVPDLIAYSLYRFECALRASAVLGFFGIPTLGYFIKTSFANTHYHEVWTYLYVMVILIMILDAWSGAIRRRLVI